MTDFKFSRSHRPKLLTIAGSDSGGGAGIQADLKTFQMLGAYGMSAVTVLTAQNTLGVRSCFPVTPQFLTEQIDAVMEDIGCDAVKLGALFNAGLIEATARAIEKWKIPKVVLDPVMAAKGGSRLLDANASGALKDILFPLVSIITPNLLEAEILTGLKITTRAEMETAAEALLKLAPRVVLKGGHLDGQSFSPDLYLEKSKPPLWVERPRFTTRNTHGTGCTLSSAIASFAGWGSDWQNAFLKARDYLQGAIEQGMNHEIGKGNGPVDHAWKLEVFSG